MDLSVIIPARNERFLERTIADVLANRRGRTEVIAICDGAWPNPVVNDHPDVHFIHHPVAIGQRAATNEGARISTAKYLMKLDAHCAVDEGFDVKLMAASEPNLTQIPALYNLHAFDWQCETCGSRLYQGPEPTTCPNTACAGRTFTQAIVWQRRLKRRTEFWRFDHTLHFGYWGEYAERPAASGDLVDVMSSLGACWFMERERFWQLGGMDERHGSWGNFGVEVACKSWLSGGRHAVNRTTWFSHMFRTQNGFKFPYPLSAGEQEQARSYSRNLWMKNAWPGQVRPLSWLIDKFAPIPGWHTAEGREALASVTAAGAVFRRIGERASVV
jgi:hypothetical protein